MSIKIEGATKAAELALKLQEKHYPFWSKGRLEAVKRVDLFARISKGVKITQPQDDGTEKEDALVKGSAYGNLLRAGKLANIPLPSPIETFTLYLDDNSMEDLWLTLVRGKGD